MEVEDNDCIHKKDDLGCINPLIIGGNKTADYCKCLRVQDESPYEMFDLSKCECYDNTNHTKNIKIDKKKNVEMEDIE